MSPVLALLKPASAGTCDVHGLLAGLGSGLQDQWGSVRFRAWGCEWQQPRPGDHLEPMIGEFLHPGVDTHGELHTW
jgi:hypothetical protein